MQITSNMQQRQIQDKTRSCGPNRGLINKGPQYKKILIT